MQFFAHIADALAFRGRSLVLRKDQRILAFLVLENTYAFRRHAWEETAKQHLSSAKLRDGTRDSVLALKPHAVLAHIADALALMQ